MALEPALHQRISELVADHQVLLFMKGTRHFPQCGFSATVAQILDGLLSEYKTVNVLTDPEVRQGIKEFSNWPTIPQLYVNGQFVGGCDIIREMYLAGELQGLLGVKDDASAPKISVTEAAAKAFRDASGDGQPALLRLEATPRFEYSLSVDEAHKGDFEVDAGHGVTVLVDRDTAKRTDGLVIDFSENAGGGFKLSNPNEPPRVKEVAPQELQALRNDDKALRLIDVRTEQERATASIADSTLLDDATRQELEALDKDTPLAFYCHHGQRSRSAAETFLRAGFKRVYNLTGGIDAWSQTVDSTVPRY